MCSSSKLRGSCFWVLVFEYNIVSLVFQAGQSCPKVRCAVSELWSQSVSDALQTILEDTWEHLHSNPF